MRFASTLAVISAFATAALAADFNITVGKDSKNTFDPPQITGVQQGDTVRFRFVSKSHSVTQSTFDSPCTSKTGGVDSGFQPVDANATSFPEWSIQINNVTAPMWFYCARAPHCSASGMVFAINPTVNKTFDAFQAKATASSSGSGGYGGAYGGGSAGTPGPGGSSSTTSSTTSGNGTSNSSTAPSAGAATSIRASPLLTLLTAGAALLVGVSL